MFTIVYLGKSSNWMDLSVDHCFHSYLTSSKSITYIVDNKHGESPTTEISISNISTLKMQMSHHRSVTKVHSYITAVLHICSSWCFLSIKISINHHQPSSTNHQPASTINRRSTIELHHRSPLLDLKICCSLASMFCFETAGSASWVTHADL